MAGLNIETGHSHKISARDRDFNHDRLTINRGLEYLKLRVTTGDLVVPSKETMLGLIHNLDVNSSRENAAGSVINDTKKTWVFDGLVHLKSIKR